MLSVNFRCLHNLIFTVTHFKVKFQSLGGLVNVKYLNLSHNFLSGSISKSIPNLPNLNSLDFSFNELEGKIPEGRVFSNLAISSLVGNIALCGSAQLGSPPCCANVETAHSMRKLCSLKYILPVVASTIIVFPCLYLFLTLCCKRKVTQSALANLHGLDYPVVLYHELVRANENFNQTCLIGKGSFGLVYRRCHDNGLIVAVKVLNLDVEGAINFFDAEHQALRMVRHRNLIKIISVCSNPDFKAIVLQFISSGSLDQWLYSDAHCLNFLQRLNIMVDMLLAVEHLHYHHSHTVLHCDLKPSNLCWMKE